MKSKLLAILVVALCTLGLSGYALAGNELSNYSFETWTAGPGGPPDNWSKSGTFGDSSNITATQEAVIVRTGSYSVNLTWDTTATRWLEQTVAITPDTCYEFQCYAYDNDLYGKARVAIRWFDATDTNQVGGYYGSYTSDLAAWQLMTSGGQVPPATAAFAHCELRVYEDNYDSSTWTGATIYFDDAFFDSTDCPPPSDSVSIRDIQFNNTNPGGTPPDTCYPSTLEDSIRFVRGIVTHVHPGTYPDFWLQDDEDLWSGVFYYDATVNPQRGDELRVTAQVDEYYGLTEMKNVVPGFQIVSSGNTLPNPLVVTPDLLGDGCSPTAEAYEGVLCKLNNVICTAAPNAYNEWYVTDFAHTDTCQIDDDAGYAYAASVGDTFISITGLVHYGYGEYNLTPRNSDDVVPLQPPGPEIRGVTHWPTIPGDGGNVTVMASIWDTTQAVTTDSVYYIVNDTTGVWSHVYRDSVSSNYSYLHYFTIPGQSEMDSVFFYVYAENQAGGHTASPVHKYPVLEEYDVVMVNEFMYDYSGPDTLCFIEIYGPSSLSLNGYSLVMVNGYDGTDKKVINLSGYSIPVDGYFVVAQDAGVPNYDMINALADFENGPDNIHIRKGGFTYDAVGYGTFSKEEYFAGERWPTYDPDYPYGFSLGRDPDHSDTDYNRRDFGVYGSGYNTPGAANTPAAAYTIKQIQDPASKTVHTGERVKVGGMVTVDTACAYNPGYYIEMSSNNHWSGVLVYDLFYEPPRGDSVDVWGTVYEEYDRTQISYVTACSTRGAGSMPSPMVVSTAQVDTSESLEGVLVEVQCVTVHDTLGYGEFLVTDGAIADTCMVDDICGYTYPVSPGDQFEFIRGVVDYSFLRYKIQPRDENDFGAAPEALADLTAEPSPADTTGGGSGDIFLQWTPASKALVVNHYIIFRSTSAGTMGDSLAGTTDTTYLDTDVAGDKTTNYYYVVKARYTCGIKSSDTRQVGEFDRKVSH